MAGFGRRPGVAILLVLILSPVLSAGDDPGSLSVTLEWDPNPEPDLQGYFVYRSQESGSGYVRLNSLPHPDTSFTDTGLVEGTSYFYVCTAVNEAGTESGYSNELQVLLDPGNTAPEAVSDVVSVAEDQPVAIDVLANDIDPDSDPLTIVTVSEPSVGSVAIDGGMLSYTPPPDFNGAVGFSYTISDGRGGSATADVEVTVLPVNDAPRASADSIVLTTAATTPISVLDNDIDPDGDVLVIESVVGSLGTVQVEGSALSYTPPAGFTGIDRFSYTVSDPFGATDVAEVTVDVGNRAPNAVDDDVSVDEDAALELDVLANDTDPDGDVLNIVSYTQPTEGFVSSPQANRLRFASPLNFNGLVDFTYTVSDGRGEEATATVTVTVAPVNDAPEARPDQIVVEAEGSASIDVLANDSDPDGDPLTIESVQGAVGSVVVADNRLEYQAPDSFSGIDTFSYSVGDGEGGTDSAIVRVKVDVENRPPTAVDDWSTTLTGQSVSINLIANDSDPDEDLLTIVSLADPKGGTTTLGTLGWVHFMPDRGFSGSTKFAYTISDGEAESTGEVTVDVKSLPGSNLLFPVTVSHAGGSSLLGEPMVGIALLNPGSQGEVAGLRAFDTSGQEIGSDPLGIPLPAGGQEAFMTAELVPAPGASSLHVESLGSPLLGFFTVVDELVQRMDAVGARPTAGRRLYLHQMRSSAEETTVVSILNPGNEIAEIELELFSADGEPLAVALPVLAPQGSMRGSLVDIFGDLPDLGDGWLRLRSNVEVVAFGLQASETSFTAEAASEPVRADQLTAAHFYFSRLGPDRSRLRLLNVGGATVHVVVEAFDNKSVLLAETSLNLDPGELLSEDVEELLDFGEVVGDEVSGYLRVHTLSFLGGRPSVLGSMTFSTFEDEAETMLPLSATARDNTLFPHVAQSWQARIFTGVALVNGDSETTRATIEAYDAAGRLTARRDVELGPGQRLVEMLNSERLFGSDFEQLGGHIRVRSATPIFSLALMGSGSGRFLSAIEGQATISQAP